MPNLQIVRQMQRVLYQKSLFQVGARESLYILPEKVKLQISLVVPAMTEYCNRTGHMLGPNTAQRNTAKVSKWLSPAVLEIFYFYSHHMLGLRSLEVLNICLPSRLFGFASYIKHKEN